MPHIHLHDLKVGKVSSASGVFSGDNFQYGWRSNSKTNDGNGTVSGNHNTYTEGHYTVVVPGSTSGKTKTND